MRRSHDGRVTLKGFSAYWLTTASCIHFPSSRSNIACAYAYPFLCLEVIP
jgi:hypothetical protein